MVGLWQAMKSLEMFEPQLRFEPGSSRNQKCYTLIRLVGLFSYKFKELKLFKFKNKVFGKLPTLLLRSFQLIGSVREGT